jgi:hypothetical protein
MISPHCFTKDWITRQKIILGVANPQILEKCLHTLALLGHLAETGLSFVFNAKMDFPSLRYTREKLSAIAQQSLVGQWAQLSRLKSANPEAFYYWTIVQDLLR